MDHCLCVKFWFQDWLVTQSVRDFREKTHQKSGNEILPLIALVVEGSCSSLKGFHHRKIIFEIRLQKDLLIFLIPNSFTRLKKALSIKRYSIFYFL